MRKYWELMKSQIKLDSAYTIWYWSGTASTILRVFVIYAFWSAVYDNRVEITGIPLSTMLTYVVLATLLSNYSAGVGYELANRVRNGEVAIELMRPYDLMHKLVALDLGTKITSSVRNTLPIIILSFIFIGINLPHTWFAGPLSILSAIIGVFIGAQLDMIIGILAFWVFYIWGLRILRNAILLFFSGALLPISLFPDWLQTVSTFLPFQSIVYVPVAIYTGQITGSDIYFSILMQLVWLVVIFGIIRLLWSFALRRVTIFGG
ncbi:ABC-2 family transporter protein [Paenibacillus oenotherae]|uniref:ABC-2 family transporter protein n=1 Tax=Paenibacillus oenotherae TaxID=1435645 RepID=A0ABS7DBE1_9BACL|nr:ABC-2 family transporter protein [Paenibacillus oenotherae]MBW7477260.1 ABC-2 family transporter protein [Paenibacillus oenotherae]